MDYHVFILSRVRELSDRGLTTDAAVSNGIKSTAGVVTSAAVVMVAVFAIFATLGALDFKQMGVGLAVAVLIDATIVRAVLLPASMKLLGDWNWYLPSRLSWLPQVAHEAAPGQAAAAMPAPAGSEALGIDVEERGTSVRVGLSGELDLASADFLRERLERLEAGRPQLLLIDLRQLRFMDSRGLGEIVGAVRRGRVEARRVVLVRSSGPLDRVLSVTGLEPALETVEDPAAAGFGDGGPRARP